MEQQEALQLARNFKNAISHSIDLEYNVYFSIALN